MLQQVYNTARVQQEYSKRYNKSTTRGTASLYDTVILFINTLLLIQNIRKHIKENFDVLSFFSFCNYQSKLKNRFYQLRGGGCFDSVSALGNGQDIPFPELFK